jgi:RNA polymerase sigma-70 factor (ECF subfamily)
LPRVTTRPTTDTNEGSVPTLGSIIYRDAEPCADETEWVELVRGISAGDQRALHGIYTRTHSFVFTLILRIVNSRETAEEVTLDVYHQVWLRAASYDPAGGTVVGWIMNQARSRAIDRLRFEQRKKRVDPLPAGAAPVTPDAFAHVSVGQQAELLQTALKGLTLDERQAVETAYFQELSYAQVAERLNTPVGTIKTRIRSGLAKLRARVAKDGI